LYLGKKYLKGRYYYVLRESYHEASHFRSRDLFTLGSDPGRFILYPGGNSFYIDPVVEDQLEGLGVSFGYEELEDVFWGFVRPDIRRAVEPFRLRQKRSQAATVGDPEAVPEDYHMFDRRRLYYLRTGRTDQRRIGLVPAKLYKTLAEKSRDEIEQLFMQMERILRVDEVKSYVYTIFNLPKYFKQSFARSAPHLLDQSSVDNFFVSEVCRLNDDRRFWRGFDKTRGLQEYLVRYLIMFFDYDFNPGAQLSEYIREYINSRRRYRAPVTPVAVSLSEAGRMFKTDPDELKKMGRRDLARLYRKRAMKLHPDRGGDHEQFVKLTEAYHSVMRRKP
jgi:hypothetical protein